MKRSALCPDRIPTIARQNPAHGLPTSCIGFCRRSVSCLSGSAAAQESARVPVAHRAKRPGFVSFGGFVIGQKGQPKPVEVHAAARVALVDPPRTPTKLATHSRRLPTLREHPRRFVRRSQCRQPCLGLDLPIEPVLLSSF